MRILIMIGAMVGPLLLMLGLLFAWRFIADRDRRRSPLNFKLLNLPGDGLRQRIEHHDEKMNDAALMALMAGPFLLVAWALNRLSRVTNGLIWHSGDWFYVLLGVITVGWSVYRFVHHGKQRRRCRQGFDAERAVAQNLIPLMAEGCMVFHDFPAVRFNIDHIVVAPHTVYAIETKSRRKPSTGGKAAARVGYDGRLLRFPTHAEAKPLDQAKAQAEWLRRFLSSAVGEPVGVLPVLALPGWYVDLSREGSRADVIVNNLRSPLFLMKLGGGAKADPVRQKRIAHALAERYPALED
jgi:hypothetical protein